MGIFNKNDNSEKMSKAEKLLNQYGLSDLEDEERQLMIDMFNNGCFVNNAKVMSVLSGGTVQQITNSLLVDILKSNLVLIKQNDKIIKLLENRK